MKKLRQILTFVVAFCMMFQCSLLSVFADDEYTYTAVSYTHLYEVLDGAVYKDTGKAVESGTIDEYGKVFYLKPDESAVFEKLQANRKYYVIELGVKSDYYDKVLSLIHI